MIASQARGSCQPCSSARTPSRASSASSETPYRRPLPAGSRLLIDRDPRGHPRSEATRRARQTPSPSPRIPARREQPRWLGQWRRRIRVRIELARGTRSTASAMALVSRRRNATPTIPAERRPHPHPMSLRHTPRNLRYVAALDHTACCVTSNGVTLGVRLTPFTIVSRARDRSRPWRTRAHRNPHACFGDS
jgi:hypothetical protein